MVYYFQKGLLFFPDKTSFKDCPVTHFESSDGKVRYYELAPVGQERGWILHFHGNAGRACDRVPYLRPLSTMGYRVFLHEYPGYADDKPLPGENEILESALETLKSLQERNSEQQKIILFGESLGTGPATYLASKKDTKISSLILQTPFTSLGDVGQKHYFYLPVKILLKDQFKAETWAREVEVPVFIFHGDKDEIIPFSLARKQEKNFKSKVTFWEVKGARHNDLLTVSGEELWKRLDDFMEEKKGSP